MKKIICALLTLVLLAALAVPVFAASGSVTIAASGSSLKRGDTFTVTATLSNSEAIALGTVVLQYDTSVFEMTGGTCHVANASIGQVIPGSKAGTFMYTGDPQVVSGKLFTFNMKVKDDANFGSFTISSSASVGVDNGSPISSGSTTVSVVCVHSYGGWSKKDDALHQQTCGICFDVKTADHGWDGSTVTSPATCKDTGVKTLSCSTCGGTKTETIPVSNEHSYGSWSKVDDEQHTRTCSVCQKPETAAHAWNEGTVTTPATCKTTGVKTLSCDGCGGTKTEIIPVSNEHSYGSWSKVDDEQHTRTCSVCIKVETVDHTWNSGSVTKAATCISTGEKVYTCTGCSATKTEILPQLTTHAYDHSCDTDCNICDATRTITHKYKSAWSSNSNSHWHECSVCHNKKDSTKHTPGAEATETDPQTCTVCSYIITPALGHEHSYAQEWTTDDAGHWYTCSGCNEQSSYADHDFENNCDADCSVCGFQRQVTHAFSESWKSDGTGHWHECSICGTAADAVAHELGAEATATTAQLCTLCGFEVAPATGVDNTEPVITPGTPDGSGDATNDFPWWIIILAIIVISSILFFILAKKKNASR